MFKIKAGTFQLASSTQTGKIPRHEEFMGSYATSRWKLIVILASLLFDSKQVPQYTHRLDLQATHKLPSKQPPLRISCLNTMPSPKNKSTTDLKQTPEDKLNPNQVEAKLERSKETPKDIEPKKRRSGYPADDWEPDLETLLEKS
ncbi:hypothetical protein EMCG_09134 [[Emmonsia] crescens]|uniref:Uncharacterized protein n=1 Tax=[Emmonsia] crescens TaxID=73230 RepID=A0A0G2J3F9_9EURO|nr:hypothetical protein EMCG_09134 [Emmonsia crescens UAMH 3008]